jgi:predicted lipoprotein
MVQTIVFVVNDIEVNKLGKPLGKLDGAPQPQSVESAFSDTSRDDMLANLIGVQLLYKGQGGASMSDYVRSRQASLDDAIVLQLSNATKAVEAIAEPLDEEVTQDPSKAQAAYEAVQALNITLRTRLVTALGVNISVGVPTDND